MNELDLESAVNRYQNRPLPAPPRPPRDKRRSKRQSSLKKKFYDDTNDRFLQRSYDDVPKASDSADFIARESATQTAATQRDSQTVAEILRSDEVARNIDQNEENLAKGIQKFREASQKSYSERSRTSGDRPRTPLSRPMTPSALVIEQRVTRTPIQTDATLIMQPIEDDRFSSSPQAIRRGYMRFADDDNQINTDDERIINAAIRKYQMLEMQSSEETKSSEEPKLSPEKIFLDSPTPPPRRKSAGSSASPDSRAALSDVTPVSSLIASDRSEGTPTQVNDLSIENLLTVRDDITEFNVRPEADEPEFEPDPEPVLELESELLAEPEPELPNRPEPSKPEEQSIIVQTCSIEIEPAVVQAAVLRAQTDAAQKTVSEAEIKVNAVEPDKKSAADVPNEVPKRRTSSPRPPTVPTLPADYTLPSDIPASFYQLRTGISDDDSRTTQIPPAHLPPRHRSRKHHRHSSSSSDDDHRRHHRGAHAERSPDSSIAELSGQLIRACGRALNTSMNSAGNAMIDLLRGIAHNQDEKQKDISLVLVILVVIVACLMMLGMNVDRSIHHHHWDYLNPPDHFGRDS